MRSAGSSIVVLGTEHLKPLPDRVILAGTHRRFLDLPLVRYALARSGSRSLLRSLVTAISAGPNFAGAFAWFGELAFGLHPIDQHRGREASQRALVRAARASGGSILIFPQGTHATIEAELGDDPSVRFRSGVARLAEALDAFVVPFGLAGPERVIPASPEDFHGWKVAGIPVSAHRGPLAIAFGAPLPMGPDETAQAFTARLQKACIALIRKAEDAIRDAPSEAAASSDRPHGHAVPEALVPSG